MPPEASTASAVLRTEPVPVSSCFLSGSDRYRLAARLHFANLPCISCQQIHLTDAGMQLPANVDHFNVRNHALLLRFISDSSLPAIKADGPKPVTSGSKRNISASSEASCCARDEHMACALLHGGHQANSLNLSMRPSAAATALQVMCPAWVFTPLPKPGSVRRASRPWPASLRA